MAAWEPKSLHKLHCYLGQTSVSKLVDDLGAQMPPLTSLFVLDVCACKRTHAPILCTNTTNTTYNTENDQDIKKRLDYLIFFCIM